MSLYQDVYYQSHDGLRLHARDYDRAASSLTPVLCLPGLTRNVRDFDQLAARLAPSRRVIVAEQRGRGLSAYDPNPENYHPATYVQDMLTLLDHLHLARIAIIGTSLGGLMAMLMGASAPQRLAGILLNDIGPEIDPEGIRKIQAYIGDLYDAADWEDAARYLAGRFSSAFPRYGKDDWLRFAHAVFAEKDGRLVLDFDPHIARLVQNNSATAPNLWPVFDLLADIPLAVVRGSLSNILSAATLAAMKHKRFDLLSVELQDTGHAPNLNELPSIALIDQFLASLH